MEFTFADGTVFAMIRSRNDREPEFIVEIRGPRGGQKFVEWITDEEAVALCTEIERFSLMEFSEFREHRHGTD